MSDQKDVVIIGAGVVGICTAYYLLKRGRRVTVLDREGVCAGSSYGNGGLIVPSHSVPLAAPGAVVQGLKWMFSPESPFYIKPRPDLALISWLWRFSRAATKRRMHDSIPVLRDFTHASAVLHEELNASEELDCHYERKGTLSLFRTAPAFEDAVKETQLLEEFDMRPRTLDGDSVRELEPLARKDVIGGVYHEDDAHMNPADFVRALATRVESLGGVIEPGADVTGFERSGGRIAAVHTTLGDYVTEQVVLAAGSWSPGIASGLGLKLPVQAGKGYSVTFSRPKVMPKLPVALGEARLGVTPMGPAVRLAGTLEFSGLNLTVKPRRVSAIRRAPAEYLDGFGAEDDGEVWCGMRPCTPDGLPIIGSPAGLSNLVVATGHAMIGVTLGPATGKLVAQLIGGEDTLVAPAPFSPRRFG